MRFIYLEVALAAFTTAQFVGSSLCTYIESVYDCSVMWMSINEVVTRPHALYLRWLTLTPHLPPKTAILPASFIIIALSTGITFFLPRFLHSP